MREAGKLVKMFDSFIYKILLEINNSNSLEEQADVKRELTLKKTQMYMNKNYFAYIYLYKFTNLYQ